MIGWRDKEEWLATEMAKVMPPELFLRAYGTFKLKSEVAQWIKENGFIVEEHPGCYKLKQNDRVISELIPASTISSWV